MKNIKPPTRAAFLLALRFLEEVTKRIRCSFFEKKNQKNFLSASRQNSAQIVLWHITTHNDFLPCRKSVICYSRTQPKPINRLIIQQTKYNRSVSLLPSPEGKGDHLWWWMRGTKSVHTITFPHHPVGAHCVRPRSNFDLSVRRFLEKPSPWGEGGLRSKTDEV